MATISITIPTNQEAIVKSAIERYAIVQGDLESGNTFSNAQAVAYIKITLIDRLKELVLVDKQEAKRQTANIEASNETEELSIS